MAETLVEKIKGLTSIIDTYKQIDREDCHNCKHAKELLKEAKDGLKKTEEFQSEEKGAADVVQEAEIRDGNDRSGSRILPAASGEILSSSV